MKSDKPTSNLVEVALFSGIFATIAALLAGQNGYFGLSWDALNHHIYLGLIAQTPRWHLDSVAAGSQSYQYPFLYWPIYKLSTTGLDGGTVAVIWASFQAACILPPVWLACFHLLPRDQGVWRSRLYRFLGCNFAMLNIPVLAALGTSANDLLAAVPLLWAIGLAMGRPQLLIAVGAAAALFGVAVAFKFSNALFAPLLACLLVERIPLRPLVLRTFVALGASVTAFAIAYAPWGYQLALEAGHPFHPYLQRQLAP